MPRLLPALLISASISLWSLYAYTGALPASADSQPLPSLAPMLQRVMPAVVNISTEGSTQEDTSRQGLRRYYGGGKPSKKKRFRSLGSGLVLNAEQGYILTNRHVIDEADRITVTLQDRRRLKARLVGSDPDSDVALLQVDYPKLQSIPAADSSQLRVGDFVVAIGNPFGLGQTATSGIVSALGRSELGIEGYEDFIQTDASINPGSSGGALVNLRGEWVGLNTAILAPTGGNVGIGFAIPANMVLAITDQILRYGSVRRGRIGVQIQDLNPQLADAFHLKTGNGAVITQVFPQTPADTAGLEPGHIILAVDGKAVKGASDLRNRLGLLRAGAQVALEILQRGKRRTVNLRLQPGPR